MNIFEIMALLAGFLIAGIGAMTLFNAKKLLRNINQNF